MLKNRGCEFVMGDGRLCRSPALRGERFCLFHSPEHEEEAAEARRLGGLRRRKEKTLVGAYELEGLRTVPAIQRLLEIATLDVLALENSVARARALTYICQTALRCLEVGELEERLEALEAALRSREPAPTSPFDLDLDIDEDPQPKELTP
ncbi:MAG: hypothetical protein JXA87_09965 [Thermoleophilia bacterium]|nr:hypothetical protein [Thermoleophilia bacterium]